MSILIIILKYLYFLCLNIVSIPARIKGMAFGKKSYINPGYDWLLVRLRGVVLGKQVLIGENAWIQTIKQGPYEPKITIGDKTQIGRNVTISSRKRVSIGQSCLLSFNVSIFDHEHNTDSHTIAPIESGISNPKSVVIEDNCFIGAHSFVLMGVRLGKFSVVGANSVVTRSFPAYSKIAGSPAKLIKSKS